MSIKSLHSFILAIALMSELMCGLFISSAEAGTIESLRYEYYSRYVERARLNKFNDYTQDKVNLNQTPTLKKAMEEMKERLEAAQKKLLESEPGALPVKRIKTIFRVIDDLEPNAFYFKHYPYVKGWFRDYDYKELFRDSMFKAGYVNVFNCIAISTGLLQKFVKTPEDIGNIAAVLAHEMAHGVDDFSGKTSLMHNKYGASQSMEFKADEQGRRILALAGFDPTRMPIIQRQLDRLRDKRKDGKVLESIEKGLNSHPEQRLRESVSRVATTLDRYENGWNETVPLKVRIDLEEIRSFQFPEGTVFDLNLNEPISSGTVLFQKIDQFLNFYTYHYNKLNAENVVRFNYLVSEFDRLFRNGSLVGFDQQIAHFMAVILASTQRSHSQKRQSRLESKVFIPKLLDEIPGAYFDSGISIPISHIELISNEPYFKSAKYFKMLIEQLLIIEPEYFETDLVAKSNILNTIPKELRIEYLEKIPSFNHYFRQKSISVYSESDAEYEDATGRSITRYWQPIDDFILPSFKQLPVQDKLRFLTLLTQQGAIQNALDLGKIFISLNNEELGEVIAWKNAKWSDPFKTTNAVNFEQAARAIWDKRELFAMSEIFLSNDRRIRWEWIFDAIKIDRAEGLRQLRASVSSYLRSEQYRRLLLTLKDDHFATMIPGNLSQYAQTWPKKDRVWLNQETLSLFDGAQINGISKKEVAELKASFKVRAYHLQPDLFRKDMKDRLQFYIDHNKPAQYTSEFFKRIWELSYQDLLILPTKEPKMGMVNPEAFSFFKEYEFTKTLSNSEAELFYKTTAPWQSFTSELEDISDCLLEVIAKTNLSEADQKAVIEELIIQKALSPKATTGDTKLFRSERINEVQKRLKAHELEFNEFPGGTESFSNRSAFYQASSAVILESIQQNIKNFENIQKLFTSVWIPKDSRNNPKRMTLMTAEALSLKEKVVTLIRNSSFNLTQKIKLCSIMTQDGPAPSIDEYLLELRPSLDSLQLFQFSSSEGRFYSDSTLQTWFRSWIDQMKVDGKISTQMLDNVIANIQIFMPDASFNRDDLIEEIIWNTPERSLTQADELSKLKTENLDPFKSSKKIRSASVISSYIQGFNQKEIKLFIQHIQNQPGEGLSGELRALVYRKLINDSRTLHLIAGGENTADYNSSSLAEMGIQATDDLLSSMRGDDRIPLIDFLIHSGKSPLSNQEGYAYSFAEEFLGYSQASNEMKYLRAYLKSIPEHEISVTLSYLSAKAYRGGASTSISPIFEPFRTPGKKAAQAFSTYKLGNPKQNAEAAKFKSNAKPMTFERFSKIVSSNLSAKEFAKIKRMELVGAASLKTVVEAELYDGRKVIISAIDPKAPEQNAGHLAFMKKFVTNLADEGLTIEENLLRSIIDSMERQLKQETNQILEAKKLVNLKPAMKKLNLLYQKEFDGWTISSPLPAAGFSTYPNVLVMTKAPGVTFDQLDEPTKKTVGEKIVAGRLGLLFKTGWIEGDPHVGNIIVDTSTQSIGFIDVGQSEEILLSANPFAADDRTLIGMFFYAYETKNSALLASVSTLLSEKNNWKRDEKIKLANQLQKFLATPLEKPSDALVELFKTLIAAGVTFPDKISVGVLKGFVTLEGENYVTTAQLAENLSSEIGGHFKRKIFPLFLTFLDANRTAHPEKSFASQLITSYKNLKSMNASSPCEEALSGN